MSTNLPRNSTPRESNREWMIYGTLGVLIVALWVPRFHGPIDMRWDGGVYYILGTSLAEGKGYRLLNEPGEIQAIQYPPLLPLIVAAHQKLLSTNDPWVVGQWLRSSFFVSFFVYILSIYVLLKMYLPLKFAFIGTVICLFHSSTYFMSDLLFPEVLYGLAATSFFLVSQRGYAPGFAVAAGLLGIAAFGLRTIGVALLAAWVFESFLKKEFKSVAIRGAVALIPLLLWQGYIIFVVNGPEYSQPSYDYQRAEYMFYNVSYAKNMFTFKDPFYPELGEASVSDLMNRALINLKIMPQSLGEAVSSTRKSYEGPWKVLDMPFPIATPWPVDVALFTLGGFVLTGIALQFKRRQLLLAFYLLLTIAALCLTPWPQQFSRYLMPLMPFLVLCLLVALLTMARALDRFKNSGSMFIGLVVCLILIVQFMTVWVVYTQLHQEVAFRDQKGKLIQSRLFFYHDAHRALDSALDWVQTHAKSTDILAGSMPHWMYLRTGLKSVMEPFEEDPVKAQDLLDSVPVTYLFLDEGLAVDTKRYMVSVIQQFPGRWELMYSDIIAPERGKGPPGNLFIYRRIELPHAGKDASFGIM